MKFADIRITWKQWLALIKYYDLKVYSEPPEGFEFTGAVIELECYPYPDKTYFLDRRGNPVSCGYDKFEGVTALELKEKCFRFVTSSDMFRFPVKGDYIVSGYGTEFVLVEQDFPKTPGSERIVFQKEYIDE